MPSLSDLPELIGFFSYSREDDQGSRGGLSDLRDAIQVELSAQLGRSQTDFRIWQDKAAISLGTLWENEIQQGIRQSVFFIPIVTPRALRSHHCGLEFQSFLAREAELGRADLVFPILYIPVPALEDEKLWRDDPVLSVVGTRQYLDWRELRHHDLNSTEVRQRLERFCRGITNTLHKPWVSPDERKRREAEESRQREVEEARRKTAEAEAEQLARQAREREHAEVARRAEEADRTRLAEQEARERAAEDRRRHKAAAEKQALEERAFKAARAAGSTAAIEAFLGDYPENAFAAEANKLRVALRTREDAHKRAMASDDPVALKAFWDVYKKGEDVDQVRARLRVLAPGQSRQPSKPAMIGAGAAAATLIAVVAIWIATRPATNNSQVVALATPQTDPPPAPLFAHAPSAPPQTTVAAAGSGVANTETKPATVAPPPAASPAPDPAAIAWSLLQDTDDAAALQRFASQFPDSPLRKDAETRMAALAAEQAAWNLVKDAKDPEQLRRFVRQFPESPDRSDAEQRIASLAAAPPPPPVVTAPDPHDLARLLQFELIRVGCFAGKVNGEFDDDTKAAWHKFVKLTSRNMPDDVSQDAINAVRGVNKRVCPLVCPHGQHAEGSECVANEPPPKHTVKREPPAARPRAAAPAAAAPAANVYCQGRSSGVAVSNSSNNCGN